MSASLLYVVAMLGSLGRFWLCADVVESRLFGFLRGGIIARYAGSKISTSNPVVQETYSTILGTTMQLYVRHAVQGEVKKIGTVKFYEYL